MIQVILLRLCFIGTIAAYCFNLEGCINPMNLYTQFFFL